MYFSKNTSWLFFQIFLTVIFWYFVLKYHKIPKVSHGLTFDFRDNYEKCEFLISYVFSKIVFMVSMYVFFKLDLYLEYFTTPIYLFVLTKIKSWMFEFLEIFRWAYFQVGLLSGFYGIAYHNWKKT